MEFISLHDWVTANNLYPERAKSPEYTEQVKANALGLLLSVNLFFQELGVDASTLKITSGFRAEAVNSKVKGANKSYHIIGLAVDIADPEGVLGQLIMDNYELLTKYGLWLEHPSYTKGWVHLDKGERAPRKVRIFFP